MDEVLRLALVEDSAKLFPARDDGPQAQALPPH
jgi:hypothetical protein